MCLGIPSLEVKNLPGSHPLKSQLLSLGIDRKRYGFHADWPPSAYRVSHSVESSSREAVHSDGELAKVFAEYFFHVEVQTTQRAFKRDRGFVFQKAEDGNHFLQVLRSANTSAVFPGGREQRRRRRAGPEGLGGITIITLLISTISI